MHRESVGATSVAANLLEKNKIVHNNKDDDEKKECNEKKQEHLTMSFYCNIF
jgi:hypothetical protein